MKMYELVGRDYRKTDDIQKSRSTTLFFTSYSEVSVSTVFLGWDHSFGQNSEPILFETMVFGGVYNEYQVRYHNYDKAEQGHKDVCEMISNDPIVIEFIRNQKIKELLK